MSFRNDNVHIESDDVVGNDEENLPLNSQTEFRSQSFIKDFEHYNASLQESIDSCFTTLDELQAMPKAADEEKQKSESKLELVDDQEAVELQPIKKCKQLLTKEKEELLALAKSLGKAVLKEREQLNDEFKTLIAKVQTIENNKKLQSQLLKTTTAVEACIERIQNLNDAITQSKLLVKNTLNDEQVDYASFNEAKNKQQSFALRKTLQILGGIALITAGVTLALAGVTLALTLATNPATAAVAPFAFTIAAAGKKLAIAGIVAAGVAIGGTSVYSGAKLFARGVRPTTVGDHMEHIQDFTRTMLR